MANTTSTHTHVYVIKAEHDQMVRGMKDVTGASAAATGSLVLLDQSQASATKSAKKTEVGVQSLRKVLAGLGGEAGAAGAKMVNLAEGFSTVGGAMGKVGLAAGIAGVAVIGIGTAFSKALRSNDAFVKGAIAAEQRIRGLGKVTDAQSASVRSLAETYDAAGREIDKLNVQYAAQHEDKLKNESILWAALTHRVDMYRQAISQTVIGGVAAVAGIDLNAPAPEPDRTGETRLTDAEMGPSAELPETIAKREEAIRKAEAAEAAYDQKLQDVIASSRVLMNLTTEASADTLDNEGKIRAAYDKRIEAIISAGGTEEEVAAATLAANERLERDLIANANSVRDARIRAIQDAQDADEAAVELQIERAASLREELIGNSLEAADVAIQAIQNIVAANLEREQSELDSIKKQIEFENQRYAADKNHTAEEAAAHAQRIEQLQADRDLQKEIVAEKQRALIAAFRAEQAASAAQVIFQTAVAVPALTAAMAYLGPLALPAALAITVPMAAAQLGLIASQKPPTFHSGTLAPDEMTVRRGEGAVVFNERAVQDGAMDDAIDANRRGRGRNKDRDVLTIGDFGRVIERVWLDKLADPGSRLTRSVGAHTGRRDVYGKAA